MNSRMIALTCGLLLLGAGLRIAPLFHDFWLDEAWSYLLVRDGVTHPVQVLTRLHTDNNHPLNSLALYCLGPSRDWHWYRVPAWIGGVLCIPLAGVVMRRFGQGHAAFAMLLVAASFPLTVYSVEARGYGTMLFCVLLSIESLARWLGSRDWRSCCVFGAATLLGFLSHLTFIHAYVSMFVFSVVELRKREGELRNGLPQLAAVHAAPLLGLGVLYWVFIRHVTIAGAEPTQLTTALAETIAMTLGSPGGFVFGLAGVIGFAAILFAGLARLRERSDAWHWLFFSGIVVVPLALAVVWRVLAPIAPPVFPRYFLTSILLFLLLTGYLLGEIGQQPGRVRRWGMTLLTVALAGNALQTIRFSVTGRGRYRESLEYMHERSSGEPIHLATNSDFRTSLLLSFHAPRLHDQPRFVLHKRADRGVSEDVRWFVLEFLEPGRPVPSEFRVATARFSLQQYVDFYGPSGCGWALYQRATDPQSPSADPDNDAPEH